MPRRLELFTQKPVVVAHRPGAAGQKMADRRGNPHKLNLVSDVGLGKWNQNISLLNNSKLIRTTTEVNWRSDLSGVLYLRQLFVGYEIFIFVT